MIIPTRRRFLTGAALFGASLTLPTWTRAAFAAAPTENRLVVILLRGALDGLSALVPYGDPDYGAMRGELALGLEGELPILKLDDTFALHPSLANFKRLYDKGQMLGLHAVAIPVRERSHFEAQAILEAGLTQVRPDDGWMSRALLAMGQAPKAVAFGSTLPLIARGGADIAVFMPSGITPERSAYLERVAMMYEGDPGLKDALAQGLGLEEMAAIPAHDGAKPNKGDVTKERKVLKDTNLSGLARTAGQMLSEPDGPRLAVLEARGWDTHQGQGAATGRLARSLKSLNDAMVALEKGMGDATWGKTVVVLITEFGRTVRMNGTKGTDHGTATCAFLLGGAVNGGRVVADWPGLGAKQLFEGRDLAPTMDVRSLLKGVTGPLLGIGSGAMESDVFPDSGAAKPADGLLKV